MRAPRCRVPLLQPPVASCIVLELLSLRASYRLECLSECIRTPPCQPLRYTQATRPHSPSRTCSLGYKTRTGAMMKRCVLCVVPDHRRYLRATTITRRMQNALSVWKRWTYRILISSRVRAVTRCDYMHSCRHRTDRALRTQICRFCWHHIKENLNRRCPACRREYTDEAVQFKPINKEE